MDKGPSTSTQQFIDAETQTPTDNKQYILRRKLKTLKQKVRRRDLKISNMKEVITAISKSGFSNENLDAVLKNYFEGKKDHYGKN